MYKALFILATFVLCARAEATTCSRQDAISAEQQASTLGSWLDVYKSYVTFTPRCDDGAISEGYSESVTRLLGRKWDSIKEMRKQIDHDPRFEAFVLKHIDETADQSNLDQIKENAQKHCPSNESGFCTKVIHRLEALNQ